MKINFNYLKPSYKEKAQILKNFAQTIDSNSFINGKDVKIFEKKLSKFTNVKYVATCNSGSDALLISLMSLGLEHGDEVIVPNFGYVSAIEAILILNLKPVVVDVNYEDYNISTEEIKKAISKKTKVIIPLHMFGQAADMYEIKKICRNKNIYIIEDAAQSINSKYLYKNKTNRKGILGDISCISFFPTKNLGCYGDGGAVLTNNKKLYDRIYKIRNHGQTKKYDHQILGINSRLDTLQANVLNVKIDTLEKENKKRIINAKLYFKFLNKVNGIKLPSINRYSDHIFHQFTIKVLNNKRNSLQKYLRKSGIETIIYYPKVFNQQKAFKNKLSRISELKNSIKLSKEVLSIPINGNLSYKEIEFISNNIKKYYNV